jgi:Flp pilus assembly pilin Flp
MMKRILASICKAPLWSDRRGQDSLEYALIGGLVAMAVVAALAPALESAMDRVDGARSTMDVAAYCTDPSSFMAAGEKCADPEYRVRARTAQ